MNEILKNSRLSRGLRIREVSEMTGIDQALISKFESGKRMPTRAQIDALAEVLVLDPRMLRMEWLKEKILSEIVSEPNSMEVLQMVMESLEHYGMPSPKAPKSLQALLKRIDKLVKRWEKLRVKAHSKVVQAIELEYTFESNRIEGNTLTLQQTDLVVNKGLTISGKSLREHFEAVNHTQAIDFVKAIATEELPISERDLKQIHRLVLTNIEPDEAGQYRRVPVYITGTTHVPVAPEHLTEAMSHFFQWYRNYYNVMHPVLMAAELHFRLVSIHPFADGNGRTSRLLMNLHLMQHGYPLAIIRGDSESRMNYYDALDNARTDGNLLAFQKFIAESVESALHRWVELLQGP